MNTATQPMPGTVFIVNDNINMAFVYEKGMGLKEGLNYREATTEEAEEFFRLNPAMREKAKAAADAVEPASHEATPEVKSEPKLTYGQKVVGINFNPSKDGAVDRCKQHHANIIDQMYELRNSTGSDEQARCAAIAIEHAQTAQMWAVKALTWKD